MFFNLPHCPEQEQQLAQLHQVLTAKLNPLVGIHKTDRWCDKINQGQWDAPYMMMPHKVRDILCQVLVENNVSYQIIDRTRFSHTIVVDQVMMDIAKDVAFPGRVSVKFMATDPRLT